MNTDSRFRSGFSPTRIALTAATATAAASAAACLLLIGAAPAQAQTASDRAGPPDYLALGVASVAEFPGASDRTAVPAVLGRFRLGPMTLRLQGNRAQLNLMPAGSPWALGPTIGLRQARDADVKDSVVQRLRPVDAGGVGGVFVDYSWRGLAKTGDSLTAGIELLSGKTGGQSRLNLGYQLAPLGNWFLNVGVQLSTASSKYQQTYFSVDADNALRSGLPQFTAESGLNEASLSLGATYALSRQWLLIGFVQAGRLQGDAADSPIVKLRGNKNLSTAAIAVGYQF
jgi:outer membrane protein